MAEAAKGGGLRNVVAGETRISTIDGERGILRYGGIDIHQLAEHSSFEEVVFLLHQGRLPSKSELSRVREELAEGRTLPRAVKELLFLLPPDAHPMASLRTAVSMLGALETKEPKDTAAQDRQAMRLIAQTASIVAGIDRARRKLEPIPPDPRLSLAADFLRMLTGERPSPRAERVMDIALVLHADHEFNASTFTGRVTASTLADLHGAITAAIATLKGPLHGGANEAVMQTLQEIGSPDRVESWLAKALADKRKIMGFGHAVYRTEDPRATHLRRLAKELTAETGRPEYYEMTARLEAGVKAQKGLWPNVDLYSASVYHALGIPTDLFTPVFAVSRVAGWTAHVLEQLRNNKLIRPEASYVGPTDVPYVPLEQR